MRGLTGWLVGPGSGSKLNLTVNRDMRLTVDAFYKRVERPWASTCANVRKTSKNADRPPEREHQDASYFRFSLSPFTLYASLFSHECCRARSPHVTMYIPLRFKPLDTKDRRSKRKGKVRSRNENCLNRLVLRRCSLALSGLPFFFRIPRKTPDPAAYGK